jgi:hypothetical protein
MQRPIENFKYRYKIPQNAFSGIVHRSFKNDNDGTMNKLSRDCPAWLSTFLTCGRDNDNKALSVKNNGMALNGLENNPFVNDFKTFSL